MANTVDLFDDYNDENVALCDGFDLLCNVEFFVKAIENQNHTQIQKCLTHFSHETIENKFRFVNSLWVDLDNNVYKRLVLEILDILTWAPTSQISKIKINPLLSVQHRDLAEYQSEVLSFRSDMMPIHSSYDAPHVVLSLCANEKTYFAKYFNGTRWCKLQMHEHVLASLPDLTECQFAIVGNELWYISDDFLYNLDLFAERPIIYYVLSQPIPRDIQLCKSGETLIILSRDKKIAEVISKASVNQPFEVSEWYDLRRNEYAIQSSNEDFTTFEINLRYLRKSVNVCLSDKCNSLYHTDNNIVGEYSINPNACLYRKTYLDSSHVKYDIPKDNRDISLYVLLDKTIFEQYLNQFYSYSGTYKRKHSTDVCEERKKRSRQTDIVDQMNELVDCMEMQ